MIHCNINNGGLQVEGFLLLKEKKRREAEFPTSHTANVSFNLSSHASYISLGSLLAFLVIKFHLCIES